MGTSGGTSYTVTFETNGGSAVDPQTVADGETAKKPEAPKKGDYKFGGWYSDSGLTTPFSFDTAITADITLYAMWTEKAVIQAGSISYATTSVSKTTAEAAFTNTLTKTGDGTVTYTSSDEAVATVHVSSGQVTIKGAGTATITAKVEDSDTYTYATKTASYTLTVTYIGSKAPSEAKALGDIVFTDGSATPYSADLTLTAEQKAAAVAVIFYAGSASDKLGAKTLGVGLVQGSNLEWAKTGTTGCNTSIATLLATKTSGSNAGNAVFSGTLANDGSESLTKLKEAVSDYSEADYPAWAWIEGYAATANLTGTSCESGWYIPSIGEVCVLWNATATVNNSINKTSGTRIATNKWYRSSNQATTANNSQWYVGFGTGDLGEYDKNSTNDLFCAVRAF